MAGTRFSSAGIALEETATRGFDFMEDRPVSPLRYFLCTQCTAVIVQ